MRLEHKEDTRVPGLELTESSTGVVLVMCTVHVPSLSLYTSLGAGDYMSLSLAPQHQTRVNSLWQIKSMWIITTIQLCQVNETRYGT